jgi:hypothetical protein
VRKLVVSKTFAFHKCSFVPLQHGGGGGGGGCGGWALSPIPTAAATTTAAAASAIRGGVAVQDESSLPIALERDWFKPLKIYQVR